MSNTESGLMKQTKKELVAIILRKDDTENGLRKELADVKLDFDKAKKMIDERDKKITDKDSEISNLKLDFEQSEKNVSQHQDTIDELTVINADVEHSLRNAKRWNVALAILFVCAVVAAIVF